MKRNEGEWRGYRAKNKEDKEARLKFLGSQCLQQRGKKRRRQRQSDHVTRAWEKKMKDLERNHGIGWGKVARVDGVTWATNRAHIGEKEKEERRLPRSRAQCMGLSEETEGLDEEGS